MPDTDTDLSTLSPDEYARKRAEFLSYTKQVAKADRLARQAEFRSNAKKEDLSTMTDAQFQLAKQRCLRNIARY